VLQRHTSLRPDQFAQVEVREKEYAGPAWIRVLSRSAATTSGTAGTAGSSGTAWKARSAPPRAAASSPQVQNNFFDEVRDTGVIGISIAEQDMRR
jgi:hypothetical protein